MAKTIIQFNSILRIACFLCCSWSLLAEAQSLPASVSQSYSTVDDLIRKGQELERNLRWDEVLSYYEKALDSYPDHPVILRRMETAKIHYGIGRRYSDSSFVRCVRQLSEEDALKLYSEVLVKVSSHYVDQPSWQDLVDKGTHGTLVALHDNVFQNAHLENVPQDWVSNFQRDLNSRMSLQTVRSRQDSIEATRLAGRLARRHLGVAPAAIILEYTYHAILSLDDYSTYLTPNQLGELFSQIDGNFVGLGIELQSDNGALLIVKVIDGSPAKASGIMAGDRIIEVDGKPTKGLTTDQAASMLQGTEGSTVVTTVQAPNGSLRRVQVTRRRIDVPSIDNVKILDRQTGLGYFQLTTFQKTTAQELDKALWHLHRNGMKSLVMDLRGNPGGLLTTSVEVADRFIAGGKIVSTKGRSPDQNWTYSAHKSGTWQMPLIVLIDEDSASAAEIFAGAIRDHRRGYIVGNKSYGKGSVQSIFSLANAKSGLRLTTAKFYSPLGKPYSKIGVSPHIQVRTVAKPANGQLPQLTAENDPVIREALRLAKERF